MEEESGAKIASVLAASASQESSQDGLPMVAFVLPRPSTIGCTSNSNALLGEDEARRDPSTRRPSGMHPKGSSRNKILPTFNRGQPEIEGSSRRKSFQFHQRRSLRDPSQLIEPVDQEAEALAVFSVLDVDGDGIISQDDLAWVGFQLGLDVPSAISAEMLDLMAKCIGQTSSSESEEPAFEQSQRLGSNAADRPLVTAHNFSAILETYGYKSEAETNPFAQSFNAKATPWSSTTNLAQACQRCGALARRNSVSGGDRNSRTGPSKATTRLRQMLTEKSIARLVKYREEIVFGISAKTLLSHFLLLLLLPISLPSLALAFALRSKTVQGQGRAAVSPAAASSDLSHSSQAAGSITKGMDTASQHLCSLDDAVFATHADELRRSLSLQGVLAKLFSDPRGHGRSRSELRMRLVLVWCDNLAVAGQYAHQHLG